MFIAGDVFVKLDEVKEILDNVQDDCLVIVTLFGPFSGGNNTSGHMVTGGASSATRSSADTIIVSSARSPSARNSTGSRPVTCRNH